VTFHENGLFYTYNKLTVKMDLVSIEQQSTSWGGIIPDNKIKVQFAILKFK